MPKPLSEKTKTEIALNRSEYRMKMTKTTYAQEGGTRCPRCRGQVEPSSRFSQGEDGDVLQKVHCLECGLTYSEVYKLKGYIL